MCIRDSLTLGERAASGLGKGGLGQVFVEGSNGHVVLMNSAVLAHAEAQGIPDELRRAAFK